MADGTNKSLSQSRRDQHDRMPAVSVVRINGSDELNIAPHAAGARSIVPRARRLNEP